MLKPFSLILLAYCYPVSSFLLRHDYRLNLFDALFFESNPIPIKTALADLGRIRPEFRLPLVSMTPENHERLKQVMARLGIA